MALGGLSLRESTPLPGDAVGRVGTLVAFLFLKTKPTSESSLSEVISNTLFPLSGVLEHASTPRPVGPHQWEKEK